MRDLNVAGFTGPSEQRRPAGSEDTAARYAGATTGPGEGAPGTADKPPQGSEAPGGPMGLQCIPAGPVLDAFRQLDLAPGEDAIVRVYQFFGEHDREIGSIHPEFAE